MRKNKKTKESKRRINIPFWAQILAILLVGIIVSGVILLFAWKKQQAEPEENILKHTVTFAYPDGSVIERKDVVEGKGVFPPSIETNGVFRGWSAGFNAVKSDIEVHPVVYFIKEENLFYFDSVYVKEDTEFTLDLYVGGSVNFSSGNITLTYDSDVLEYKKSDGIENLDVSESKDGELTIKINSSTPLKEKTLIGQLTFYAKKKDAYSTQINLTARDVQFIADGRAQTANCATINNKIYFLQEVEE